MPNNGVSAVNSITSSGSALSIGSCA